MAEASQPPQASQDPAQLQERISYLETQLALEKAKAGSELHVFERCSPLQPYETQVLVHGLHVQVSERELTYDAAAQVRAGQPGSDQSSSLAFSCRLMCMRRAVLPKGIVQMCLHTPIQLHGGSYCRNLSFSRVVGRRSYGLAMSKWSSCRSSSAKASRYTC